MNAKRSSALKMKIEPKAKASKKTPSRGTHRKSPRKELSPRAISSMASLDNLAKICRGGELVQVSSSGILILVKREDLIPQALRQNLNIDSLVGGRVLLHLEDMDLEISGKVARTRYIGKKGFEIGIDYSEDAPEYWRECLVDLLPAPSEMEEMEED